MPGFFDDADAMREEIRHLRTAAKMTTDPRVLAQIQMLIEELESRLGILSNGHGTAL
jgi:hypothetical protein